MVSLKTTLCGIELDNPIIPASGTYTFEQGEDYIKIGLVKYDKVEK